MTAPSGRNEPEPIFYFVQNAALPRDWLQRQYDAAAFREYESIRTIPHYIERYGKLLKAGQRYGMPFTDQRVMELLCRLAANMNETDELWYFRSPEETWNHLCGREGYVILRDGEVVAIEVSEMN